ncbi:hypothetical protein BZM27_52920 [Paraburkholderia steynii]|uniref:Uncharacterized protein n=1 Tax=Paraburkholderia steynii TaxID=1245441 RepID=A0A4R0WYR5_9BURK|nr:hypothetical protein BZM27_52920 [Paraburkholderia steynii]
MRTYYLIAVKFSTIGYPRYLSPIPALEVHDDPMQLLMILGAAEATYVAQSTSSRAAIAFSQALAGGSDARTVKEVKVDPEIETRI